MRAALCGALVLACSSLGVAQELSKKEQYLAAKQPTDSDAKRRWQSELDGRIGEEPAPLVNLYTTWHREFLPVDRRSGVALPQATTDTFFRCHFTQVPTDMDPQLVGVLIGAAIHFDVTRVNVVSGYRAPKYNLILQKKGREVSRNSQHTLGKAVDFRIPGITVKRLHSWVRSLRLGGVGFYRHSRFIHADTGKIRYWTGR